MPSWVDWPDSGGRPAGDMVQDHWTWRPDWTSERPRLMWYLTFEDRPEVDRFTAGARDGLSLTGADVIPGRWLHLTLCDIGFRDEVTPRTARQVAADVAAALRWHPAETMTLGPLQRWSDAVVLAAGPRQRLRRLRDLVHDATLASGLRPTPDDEEFVPHVSLSYLNAATDGADVRRLVAEAAPRTLEIGCDRVTQVLVSRSHGHYHWEQLAQVPLQPAFASN